MISKKLILIACIFFVSISHAQKDGKDFAIIKAGLKLQALQSQFQKISNHAKNLTTGNPSEYVLKSESENGRSTAVHIYSEFSAISIEIYKSESEYTTFKKISTFPTELKTLKRKIQDYIDKAKSKAESLEYKFSSINKSKYPHLESSRKIKIISTDGKSLIRYYQSIVKTYGEYLNAYKQ